jgi:hypothetical protein
VLVNAEAERSLREMKQQLSDMRERLAQMHDESQRVMLQKDSLLDDMRAALEAAAAPETKQLSTRKTELDATWHTLVTAMAMREPTVAIPLTKGETEVWQARLDEVEVKLERTERKAQRETEGLMDDLRLSRAAHERTKHSLEVLQRQKDEAEAQHVNDAASAEARYGYVKDRLASARVTPSESPTRAAPGSTRMRQALSDAGGVVFFDFASGVGPCFAQREPHAVRGLGDGRPDGGLELGAVSRCGALRPRSAHQHARHAARQQPPGRGGPRVQRAQRLGDPAAD